MTSASTLIRRAAKAKTAAEGAKLRAQAAKLRREARDRVKHGDPKVRMPPPNPATEPLLVTQARLHGKDTAMHFEHSAEQGWTPMPTEPEPLVHPIHAEDILKTARRKDATPELIHQALLRIGNDVRSKTKREDEIKRIEDAKRLNEINAINVVCAFVAAAEGWAKANGGPMPKTAIIAGYTLARVVDALHNAGYTADGLKSMSRGALEARLNR